MIASGRFPNATTAIVAATLLFLPLVVSISLANQIVVYATGTLSVTLLLGAVGLLSFGQGLYFGLGAYLGGSLLRDAGLGLLPSLFASMLGATVLAVALGLVLVRRFGVYFVMLTLAFAQMGYFAMLASKSVSGGENGLTGLPRSFSLLGLAIGTPGSLYGLTAGAFFAAFLLVQRLLASPFGSVLVAVRENEARSEALGYDVRRYKIAAFAVAGGIAGLAGGLHAVYLGFVPPSDIELDTSQRLLVMAIIGGVGSPAGALAGSVFYGIVSDALSSIWPRWLGLIAILLIGIVLFLPGGLWSAGQRLADRLGRRAVAGG